MQPDPAHPVQAGLFNGEALVLWRLCRSTRRIHCFVAEWPGAYWLAVECAGGALLASDTLATIDAVLARSEAARLEWIGKGWTEE